MSTELIINASLPETRIALIEDGEIQDLLVERASDKGIVGNIYKGRVTRVLPGMQAAFVDIGLEKAAFLYVDDVYVHSEVFEEEEGITLPESDGSQSGGGGHRGGDQIEGEALGAEDGPEMSPDMPDTDSNLEPEGDSEDGGGTAPVSMGLPPERGGRRGPHQEQGEMGF